MQIAFSSQKNNNFNPPKYQVDFGAGFTHKMVEEIQSADVLEISNRLAKKGINTNFNGNKVVAWCGSKTVEIFEQLNKRFGTHLALPDGIYVEDFDKLNIPQKTLASFCNLAPSNLRKNSNDIVPAKTLFFNTFETVAQSASQNTKWIYNWENIDEIADINYLIGHSSTDHFLGTFIQEASHNAHLVRVSKKIGGDSLVEKIKLFDNEQTTKEYLQKCGKKLAQISTCALKNPLEAVASDMSKIIAESLDPKTLNTTKNPFIGTPYENLSFWQRANIPNYSDEERPLNELLRNFWNGKFD